MALQRTGCHCQPRSCIQRFLKSLNILSLVRGCLNSGERLGKTLHKHLLKYLYSFVYTASPSIYTFQVWKTVSDLEIGEVISTSCWAAALSLLTLD